MNRNSLTEIRVLEITQGPMGSMCAKILGDFGADVVKVEPPEGDASRLTGPFPDGRIDSEASGQFIYLNANKRSISIDISCSRDYARLRDLLKWAEVLVTDLRPDQLREHGLEYATVRDANSLIIHSSVTHFGQTGPYCNYKGSELVAFQMGGVGYETPSGTITDIVSQPPLKAGGRQSEYQAAWTTATATMIAIFHRDAYGEGQMVDVSAFDSVANMIRDKFSQYSYDITGLPESRMKSTFSTLWPCLDGYISTTFSSPHWWEGFKKAMGEPDWLKLPEFKTQVARRQNMDAVEDRIKAWMKEHTKKELLTLLGNEGVPVFTVNSMAQLVEARHYKERDVFVEQQHPVAGPVRQPGPPVKLSETPWSLRRPSPKLGEHNEDIFDEVVWADPHASGLRAGVLHSSIPPRNAEPGVSYERSLPLSGIRVLDFGWVYAMPHCTQWLATMGAEVLRVESQERPEWCRTAGNRGADGMQGINRSSTFNANNFSKLGVTLNLKETKSRQIVKELVAISDVVTENFTVGVLDRMGLDYDTLRQIRPDLIMLSSTTLGSTGPDRFSTGWGPNIQSYSGLSSITGYANGPPTTVGANWPDYVTGTVMAFAVLSALRHRRRTGTGQHIDLSMAEVITTMIPEAILEFTVNGQEIERMGNRDQAAAPHNVYPGNGHDQWLAISVTSKEEWTALCEVVGHPEWTDDQRFQTLASRKANEDALDAAIANWSAQHEPWTATAMLQDAGVPAGPVLHIFDLFEDPHLIERRFLVEVDHPEVGPKRMAGLPARFTAIPFLPYRHAPLLGEHNELVFQHILGLSPSLFKSLIKKRIIH